MRTLPPALLLGIFMAFFGAVRPVGADTAVPSTPSPAATPAPTVASPRIHVPRRTGSKSVTPAADDLLARMREAMVRQGSVHVDFRMISALYPVGQVTTHLRGDVSWKLSLLHDRTIVQRTDSGHVGSAPLETIDLRLVHQRAASHSRAGSWQCQNLAHVQVMSTLLGLEETVLTDRVVGTDVVNGERVWKVRATGYSPATGSGTVAEIVYDIAQSDSTLQRVLVTGTPSFGGRTQRTVASETYTRYGETVSVQLPEACSQR